jgi:nicotinamide-nucleotide amidase
MITAEIITIGNELLSGKQTDTNRAMISLFLGQAGIDVVSLVSVGDRCDHIRNAILDHHMQCDLKIISGGLGPTHDDITREVLCECFDCELMMNEQVLSNIEKLFKARNLMMTALNRRQAMVPAKAQILMNDRGTAPGLVFEQDQVLYIALPAVPFELEFLMKYRVISLLKEKFGELNAVQSMDFVFTGIGESFLYDMLLEKTTLLTPDNEFAFLPSPGIIKFRQTLRNKSESEASGIFDETEQQILKVVYHYYIGRNIDNIASLLQKIFIQRNMTVSVAESCTGGYISHLITTNSGSSQWFKGGVIAYSNEVKMMQLGVEEQLLEQYGAVSEEVVRAMAEGVRQKLQSDFAIAVSGIAGPDGGTDEKPVGTVWIAVASNEKTIVKLHTFGMSDRTANIRRAANAALMMVLEEANNKTFSDR